MTASAFGVEHVLTKSLRERAKAAKNPLPVKRTPADSSAIASTGYQRQTRRLAVEMHSRPGQPYHYRATPAQAQAFGDAESAGKHYSAHIRGKYRRKDKVTLADRGRLFRDPPRTAKAQKDNS